MALGWRGEYSRYKGFFLNIVDVYRNRPDFKMFLEILLSITATIIFAVFALKPTILTIVELFREIKSNEELIVKMDTKIANLNQAQALMLQEQARINLLDTALPDSPNPQNFILQAQGTAYNDSVTMLASSLDEATLLGEDKTKLSKEDRESLPQGASGINFNFSFSGDYPQLTKLISDFEKMRRPVKIDSVGLSKSLNESEEATDNINLTLSGKAPYFRQEVSEDSQSENTQNQ